MPVRMRPEAEEEFLALEHREREAMENAIRKLIAAESRLRFPHCSAVMGLSAELRELRPRQGRSRFRAFYRRVGADMVVAARGPEAHVDRQGFERAVARALSRLSDEEA